MGVTFSAVVADANTTNTSSLHFILVGWLAGWLSGWADSIDVLAVVYFKFSLLLYLVYYSTRPELCGALE